MFNPNGIQQRILTMFRDTELSPGAVYVVPCPEHCGFMTGMCFLAASRGDLGFILPDHIALVRLMLKFHSIGKTVRLGIEFGSLWLYADTFSSPVDVGDVMSTTYNEGSYLWCDFRQRPLHGKDRTYITRRPSENKGRK